MEKRQTGRISPNRPLERVEIDEIRIDLITVMARAGMSPPFSEGELEATGLNDKDARWWMAMAIDAARGSSSE